MFARRMRLKSNELSDLVVPSGEGGNASYKTVGGRAGAMLIAVIALGLSRKISPIHAISQLGRAKALVSVAVAVSIAKKARDSISMERARC